MKYNPVKYFPQAGNRSYHVFLRIILEITTTTREMRIDMPFITARYMGKMTRAVCQMMPIKTLNISRLKALFFSKVGSSARIVWTDLIQYILIAISSIVIGNIAMNALAEPFF
jgi:ABC-type phosphate/phosphonate transport system permease subunit